ncbi:MAG TPA: hypothetical protein DEP69_03825, partial [Acidimicrobiaceae bacterium]|nr:hypothetical protein [Acidimicrobiaceae bacterium]
GAARTKTLSLLPAGKLNHFVVRAVNAAGPGPSAGASATPATTPGPVAALTAGGVVGTLDRGLATAVLSWQAPAADGGSPLTRYQYRYGSRGFLGDWTDIPGDDLLATSFTTPNQRLGHREFRIRACNEIGCGPEEQASLNVVLTPAGVTGLTAATGTVVAAVDLAWTAPARDGGSPVTRYEWTSDSGSGTFNGSVWRTIPGDDATATKATVAGPELAGGITRAFAVRAVNAAGAGARSNTAVAAAAGKSASSAGVTFTAFGPDTIAQGETNTYTLTADRQLSGRYFAVALAFSSATSSSPFGDETGRAGRRRCEGGVAVLCLGSDFAASRDTSSVTGYTYSFARRFPLYSSGPWVVRVTASYAVKDGIAVDLLYRTLSGSSVFYTITVKRTD